MEDGHDRRKELVDDCRKSEVLLKQEPLDEDVYSDVKYQVFQKNTEEPYVHSLPVETCMKQGIVTTCNTEALGVCSTVKTEVGTDSSPLDDVDDFREHIPSEVSVKQDPLDDDVYSDVKYPVVQKRAVEPYVHSLPVATCKIEAHGVCPTVKTENGTDPSPLDDVLQARTGHLLCKVETVPVVQHTCTTNVQFTSNAAKTVVLGPDSHLSLPVSTTLAGDKTPFPVALYRRQVTLPCTETTRYKCNQGKLPRKKGTHCCSICDYSSFYKRYLVSHMRIHTGEKRYKCSVCEFSATYKSTFEGHMRIHTGEKPYKCSICDYRSNQKSRISNHMRTHTGEKPFKCSVCDFTSAHKKSVATHMKTHTGDKPYKCSFCDYCSAYRQDLVSHTTTHTGEKPYKCSFCTYSSRSRSTLVTHRRIHTGEKPYRCSICDYSAYRKCSVVKHTKIHTREKPLSHDSKY